MSENLSQPTQESEVTKTPKETDSQAHAPKEHDNKYWLTLDQWSKDPEFAKLAEQEFKSSPLKFDSGIENGTAADKDGGWARREFLQLMGASLAMTTVGCIRRPVEKIVPYTKQPEEVTFGIANYYTSSFTDGGDVLGLLVKTREGRPLKIEGNPEHPLNQGGLSSRANAHILSLYDPERLTGPRKNLLNKERTNRDTVSLKWEDADADIAKQLGKGGVAILTGALSSPATRNVVAEFASAFKAKHVVWEPLSYEDIREGQKASYGDDTVPFYRFDKAKMIVSIDADFLGTWIAPTTFTRQFSKTRKDFDKMSRMVSFESAYSLTGGNSDIRVRIKPSQQISVAMGLAHELVVKKNLSRFAGNVAVKTALLPFANVATELGIESALFAKIADDLWENKGKSLIVAGGIAGQTEAARELQVAVNFLNSLLDNDGSTVDARAGFSHLKGSFAALSDLIQSMKKGEIKTLILHRSNPAYALTQSAEFVEALKKVEMVITTADRIDETAKFSHFVLPDSHVLESWNDAESAGGIMSLQQPTIRPMHDTRSFQLSLITWAAAKKVGSTRLQKSETWYDYLRSYWKESVHTRLGKGKSFDAFWDDVLQKGVAGDVSSGGSARTFKAESLNVVKPQAGATIELVMYPTVALADGTLSNVSWLHELPDPITKVVWDNYASVSMAFAEKMKLKQGDMVELIIGTAKLSLPVYVQPGLHDEVIAIAVGFGRTAAGKIGNGIGGNSYSMTQIKNGRLVYSGQPVSVSKKGQRYELATTAGNHSMEGRQIVAEATLKEYLKNKGAGIHKHPIFSIWSGHQYNGHKWGMSVDLNTCTGCSACVTACQSENNIPVVGKKYVLQGREMHWLRIDRYFVGDPKDAQAVFQPVMCQQCDNAPCETVCPVLATVHSDEGLNDMVYNRCVGTRYCSNNCPYKVRRFNWFNYAKNIEKPTHMALNPDVTVRSRGVMEKCTFCVHKIKAVRQASKIEQREIRDGEIKTACEQSCPTGAIVFGDMNDKNSRVAKLFQEQRSYALLEEFHAAPSVRYMSKIRNNFDETRHKDDSHKGGHA
jgi:MoCo/4Fe-4S cofactor protein with predicted Tat translocation signal